LRRRSGRRFFFRCRGRRGLSCGTLGRSFALGTDDGKHGSDLYGVAFVMPYLEQSAAAGARDFGVDLVSRYLKDRFVFLDLIADFF
jgi:hypothetical protein